MSDQATALALIEHMGGKQNIKNVSHCVTRLRFVLKDESKVDLDAVKGTDGVLDCIISSGQYQVVIGPGVATVYQETIAELGDTFAAGAVTASEEASEEKRGIAGIASRRRRHQDAGEQEEKRGIAGIASRALDTLVACFVPTIPVFAGSGMIKVLAVLLNFAGVLPAESSTYQLLNMVGDAVFYFLPFFVAYNAAKKMEVDVALSMVLAAIIMHPTLATLGEAGTSTSLFGLPVAIVAYNAQALPSIFGVWLLKYVDRFAAKVSPKIVSMFLRPMISLLVTGAFMLCIVGPVASGLNNLMFQFCLFMQDWGPLAVAINALLFPLMVLTGTHNASTPLIIQMFSTQGFDPIFLVSGLAANIAEAGAACAVAARTKNAKLKSTGFSATLQALLGVTEPALYGVNLRMKRPFFSMLAGAAIGGFVMGLVGLAAPAFATPSVLTMLIFVPAGVNILLGIGSVVLTFVVTFLITFFVGFKDLEPEA